LGLSGKDLYGSLMFILLAHRSWQGYTYNPSRVISSAGRAVDF
jgi:hypothetical protein